MRLYSRRAWLLLLVVYLGFALWYSAIIPLCETSDELWHAGFAVHLARGGGLPVQQGEQDTLWRQEGSQPPLYYMLLALVARGVGLSVEDFEQACPRNPHAYLGDATRMANRNLSLHGPWQAFPWRGAVLTLHVWRGISVLLGGLAVMGTYGLARVLFPHRPGWALGAGLVVALNPMFLFITSGITNDALINALAAVTLWYAAYVWRHGPTWGRAIGAGLLLGAAALAKLSGLTLWPVVIGVWLVAAYERGRWRDTLRHVPVILVLAVAISGWWYWRNWMLYGDPTGLQAMLDTVGRRNATWQDLLAEWEGFRRSFWGVFGGMNVLMPAFLYTILDGWAVLALLGLAGYLFHLWRVRAWRMLAIWGGLLGYILLVLGGLIRWTLQTLASQGRLLFPALAPIALALWVGWDALVRPVPWRGARVLARALPLGMLAVVAGVAPSLWIAPVYTPERWRIDALPPQATPVTVAFGDVIRLIGYELPNTEAFRPGDNLDITLYLEQTRPSERPWSLFVHVVDDAGIIVTQEDRYPFLGLLDTTRIPSGTRWQEPVRLRLPDTAFTPATIHLQLGFYNLSTMERLPVTGPEGLAWGDHIRLGTWKLQPRPGMYPNPTSYRFGERIELVGFEISPRVARPGDTVTLVLYWRSYGPLDRDYVVFTHVLEPPQTIWGQQDKAPEVPTTRWEVGEVYRETYTLTLKPETPPGLYEIEIGWYWPETGERLRLLDGRTYVLIGRIRVVP